MKALASVAVDKETGEVITNTTAEEIKQKYLVHSVRRMTSYSIAENMEYVWHEYLVTPRSIDGTQQKLM